MFLRMAQTWRRKLYHQKELVKRFDQGPYSVLRSVAPDRRGRKSGIFKRSIYERQADSEKDAIEEAWYFDDANATDYVVYDIEILNADDAGWEEE